MRKQTARLLIWGMAAALSIALIPTLSWSAPESTLIWGYPKPKLHVPSSLAANQRQRFVADLSAPPVPHGAVGRYKMYGYELSLVRCPSGQMFQPQNQTTFGLVIPAMPNGCTYAQYLYADHFPVSDLGHVRINLSVGGWGVMAFFHGGDYEDWLPGNWYVRARMADLGGKNVGPWSSWQRTVVIGDRSVPTILSPADNHIFTNMNSGVSLKFKSNLKRRLRDWLYEFEWKRAPYYTKADIEANLASKKNGGPYVQGLAGPWESWSFRYTWGIAVAKGVQSASIPFKDMWTEREHSYQYQFRIRNHLNRTNNTYTHWTPWRRFIVQVPILYKYNIQHPFLKAPMPAGSAKNKQQSGQQHFIRRFAPAAPVRRLNLQKKLSPRLRLNNRGGAAASAGRNRIPGLLAPSAIHLKKKLAPAQPKIKLSPPTMRLPVLR